MRNRTASDETEAIGTDAFLDIVANLVGILLILIMVIGVRMDDASHQASQAKASLAGALMSAPPTPPPPIEIPDVEPARQEVAGLESSVREVERQAAELAQLTQIQKLDRDNLMLAVAAAEHELRTRRESLDQEQRDRVELDLRLEASREQQQSLIEQVKLAELTAKQKRPEVIQHVATPLAKTVFAHEEHFRLQQGELVYVPLNEMTRQLRVEAPKKLWKLSNSNQLTETIGPLDGFYLRYTLVRNRVPISAGAGLAVREAVELDRFVMIPDGQLRGEPLDEALGARSEFRRRLAAWDPHATIITVWTYPDSFREFRELKTQLYQLGFLTAARPLPDNQLISGSPHGTRSAAQ